MVLEHIAQHPHAVVIVGPVLDVHRLRHRDLDVIHVAPVPDGLEDGIGEAEEQDVLRRFLAQVVVDAVDLAFIKYRMQHLVQLTGGSEIIAKGFLDDDPAPGFTLVRQASLPQAVDHRDVMLGSGCQVVQAVGGLAFTLGKELTQALEVISDVQVALEVDQLRREVIPVRLVEAFGAERLYALQQAAAKGFIGVRATGKPNNFTDNRSCAL